MLGIVPFEWYSPRKIAAATENGADIIKAKNEVSKVPIRKGNIPKCSLTGSQVLPHKNWIPLALMAGHEEIVKVRKNAERRIMVIIAEKLSHLTNNLFSNILQFFIKI